MPYFILRPLLYFFTFIILTGYKARSSGSGSDDDDNVSTVALDPNSPWLRGGGSSPEAAAPFSVAQAQSAGSSAAAEARAAGRSVVVVRLKNVGEISLEALKAMVKAAGTPVILQADSMNGNAVDVRLELNPAGAVKGINLFASTTSAQAKATKALFQRWFNLGEITVASLSQKGSFGMPVTVMVKAASIDFIYLYNPETNTYARIEDPNAYIDANGYAHVTVDGGGDLILSAKAIG